MMFLSLGWGMYYSVERVCSSCLIFCLTPGHGALAINNAAHPANVLCYRRADKKGLQCSEALKIY